MTERSGLTRRTFARRFQAATDRRPIDHVHALRIEGARQLLETGGGAVDDVGYQVGYEDPTFFRRLFKRTAGITPTAYRRKYAAIVAAGEPALRSELARSEGLRRAPTDGDDAQGANTSSSLRARTPAY